MSNGTWSTTELFTLSELTPAQVRQHLSRTMIMQIATRETLQNAELYARAEEVVYCSLDEELAACADFFVRTYAEVREEAEHFATVIEESNVKEFKFIEAANLAFLALNAPDEDLRGKFKRRLDEWREHACARAHASI